ncbi:MAG: hypothetical protein KGI50_05305 [Patescibacteria group bacterium]|nr:hypothetical protein [Patescibacteria group bacterium]MDE2438723.1 hypothetical protein [Patescibacteria group bacterium]
MSENQPKIPKKELDKLQVQFDEYKEKVDQLTHDRLSASTPEESDPQKKMSSREIADSKDIKLKPNRSLFGQEKFNEKFREDYNFAIEQVRFIAENHEIIGESISLWTHPFAGMPYEEWIVPVNMPVWGPRHLAEQIARCYYHRLKIDQSKMTGSDAMGEYNGKVVIDSTKPRLSARPAITQKSIFTGSF